MGKEKGKAKNKKVKVCKKCSGFDVKDLKGKVKNIHLRVGCIGKCGKEYKEGKVFGFLGGEFVVCKTKEDFFEKIEEME